MQTNKVNNYDKYLNMDVKELIQWLDETFILPLPNDLHTIESLEVAEKLFSTFGMNYAFLVNLASYSKVYIRELKRDKSLPKSLAEDMIDRREAILNTMDAVDTLKNNLSRMLTIKQEIDKELNIDGFNRRMNQPQDKK